MDEHLKGRLCVEEVRDERIFLRVLNDVSTSRIRRPSPRDWSISCILARCAMSDGDRLKAMKLPSTKYEVRATESSRQPGSAQRRVRAVWSPSNLENPGNTARRGKPTQAGLDEHGTERGTFKLIPRLIIACTTT